jgi:L-alanine-DL-glutamate epimerase-like enolase superfamily enzyme
MKIKSVRAWIQNLALSKPYTIATRTISDVENVFFVVTLENGITGIGAANPASEVVGESPADALVNLISETVEGLVGSDIRHFQGLIDQYKMLYPKSPGTLAAIDIALHDAFGKYLGIPLVDFYGRRHHSLPTSVTIGIMNTTETLEAARDFRRQGFTVLKVKLGLNPEEDVERILKLREQHTDYFTIRVDANQGYSLHDLKNFLHKTSQANVELIEQPLPVGKEKELLDLPWNQRCKLAADESLKDELAAWKLGTKPRPFGIYNIKLMKCGGIRGALAIAAQARPAGIELFWGCNDESIVSITAALHAAFACPHTCYLDLDGSFDLAEDVVKGGFILRDGNLWLGEEAGLGVRNLS